MSYKVHLSKDGQWRKCSAKQGNCPLGGEEGHKSFANEQEFNDWQDDEYKREFGIVSQADESEDTYYDTESLYNTDNYLEEEDYTYAVEELNYVIDEKIIKPRGQVEAWAVKVERSSPQYGYMANHGAVGFASHDDGDLAGAIMRFSSGSDSYKITDDDGVVKVSYNHHDGSDIAEFRPVSKSKVDKFREVRNNSSHDEIIEYIEKLPELKVKK